MTTRVSGNRILPRSGILDVFLTFLRLGLTSFGGPIAHLGYFRHEFVARRRWLDDEAYTDLVALCQFLPGPASSQVGFSIGLLRAGWWGALAAWCGFTLPSALLLLVFAYFTPDLNGPLGQGLTHGLKLVAVAVVAQAVWDMARRLCPDRARTAIALAALLLMSVLATIYAQIIVIASGAVLGLVLCRPRDTATVPAPGRAPFGWQVPRLAGWLALGVFLALLLGAPLLHSVVGHPYAVFDAFYRSGALVFGGGHVVLPLLQQQTVATGWVRPGDFFAGYGAAQAVPGPLFTFAAYLGWMMQAAPNRLGGAALALVSIFLPGFLLLVGALPHWQALRGQRAIAAALRGINAAVVGLLGAALYNPLWTSAVRVAPDFAIAGIAFFLLVKWRMPPLAIVLFCAVAGMAEALIH